eukprot:5698690-Pleurochrysis_carterae.AAC.1
MLSDIIDIKIEGRELVLSATGDFAEQETRLGERTGGFLYDAGTSPVEGSYGRYLLKYMGLTTRSSSTTRSRASVASSLHSRSSLPLASRIGGFSGFGSACQALDVLDPSRPRLLWAADDAHALSHIPRGGVGGRSTGLAIYDVNPCAAQARQAGTGHRLKYLCM